MVLPIFEGPSKQTVYSLFCCLGIAKYKVREEKVIKHVFTPKFIRPSLYAELQTVLWYFTMFRGGTY